MISIIYTLFNWCTFFSALHFWDNPRVTISSVLHSTVLPRGQSHSVMRFRNSSKVSKTNAPRKISKRWQVLYLSYFILHFVMDFILFFNPVHYFIYIDKKHLFVIATFFKTRNCIVTSANYLPPVNCVPLKYST